MEGKWMNVLLCGSGETGHPPVTGQEVVLAQRGGSPAAVFC